MNTTYHEYRTQSNYLSSDPDDAGLRVRLSGDLLLFYNTARANPNLDASRRKVRDKIVEFTFGTGTRMGRYLRECEAQYRYMHTLTYPADYPSDGKTVKYHLRRYCQELMRITRRKHGVFATEEHGIFWFLEFQKRGAPHFHLLTTDFYSYRRCQMLWYAIVNSGDSKHLKAGVRVETLKRGKKGMISYAKKYARKQEQKEVPPDYLNVGRFYGTYGNKKRVAAATTFFVDSCRKDGVLAVKKRIFSAIDTLIEQKRLRLIRSDFGFRMFHVEQLADSRELQSLINAGAVEMGQFEYMQLDDIGGDDGVFVEYVTVAEMHMAKRAYLKAKYDEYDLPGVYK